MRYSHKLAFVVPTYNRPDDLRRMLTSLSGQSVQCTQCIIVDASDEPVRYILEEFPALPLDYVYVSPPSLSEQRNAGMQKLQPGITLAGYLDDDIVLLDGTLEAMLSFWETAPGEVGGARFNIEDDFVAPAKWWQLLFLMNGNEMGAVLKSGVGTGIGTVANDIYVQWLSGGATIWRREVISEFDYDEWYEGHGFLEDLDYSYRVSKKYKLVVIANARVLHLTRPLRKDRNYLLGQWQVINRIYFVKKHPELSLPLCYWAIFGNLSLSLVMGILKPRSGRLNRAWGNFVGLTKTLTGRMERIGGLFK
jgi:glycosyltransferase involved in cell wall biosynthesis